MAPGQASTLPLGCDIQQEGLPLAADGKPRGRGVEAKLATAADWNSADLLATARLSEPHGAVAVAAE